MAKCSLNFDRANKLISYNPKNGVFTWKARDSCEINSKQFNSQFAGKKAGNIHTMKCGYRRVEIRVDGVKYLAHNLAWLLMTGESLPDGFVVDHIDNDATNNTWINLRKSTNLENSKNKPKYNTSNKLKGAYRKNGRFYSCIRSEGKLHHLGYFDTEEEAHKAFCDAAKLHHGDFANNG